MNLITKVSDITWSDVQDYLRIPEVTVGDQNTLTNLIGIASKFIQSYTGLTATELDDHQDFVDAMFILIQDMWDNRVLYVKESNLNKVVASILDMHCTNLLPEREVENA